MASGMVYSSSGNIDASRCRLIVDLCSFRSARRFSASQICLYHSMLSKEVALGRYMARRQVYYRRPGSEFCSNSEYHSAAKPVLAVLCRCSRYVPHPESAWQLPVTGMACNSRAYRGSVGSHSLLQGHAFLQFIPFWPFCRFYANSC